MNALAFEYTVLLTSQMEVQRDVYNRQIDEAQQESSRLLEQLFDKCHAREVQIMREQAALDAALAHRADLQRACDESEAQLARLIAEAEKARGQNRGLEAVDRALSEKVRFVATNPTLVIGRHGDTGCPHPS